jgi:hypothetical protein
MLRASTVSATLMAICLVTGSAAAQRQLVGTDPFCVKGPYGPIKCEYQSMEHCQRERPMNDNDRCISRSQEGTVGGPTPSHQREQPSAPGEQRD